ncbi:glucosidase 2 subunit beta-like [Lineus longissimus]|uniref:glucosidase 2 subunit beta-like n=1 Tax=Lineus longissimus TaxID=88925 RepID=UPI00315C8DEF
MRTTYERVTLIFHEIMRVLKRRRTYKLLFLIMVAGLVYLGFQVFSVRLLTRQNVQTANSVVERHEDGDGKENAERLAKEKYVEDQEVRKYHGKKRKIKPTPDMPEAEREFHIPDIPDIPKKPIPDFPNELDLKKDIIGMDKSRTVVDGGYQKFSKLRQPDVPRGVDPNKVSLYKPDADGKFTCFVSKENIPFDHVNDDYCDCDDGSDEPGTSACPDSRFFCDYQIVAKPHSIFSSHVNDGICDCCDGSDEWGNVTVMEWFKINDDKHYPVAHAPCKNTCHSQEEKLLAAHKLKKSGQQLKKSYLLLAWERKKLADISAFGPQGVFFKLSTNCYTYKTAEYEYTICPWKDVRQQAFPQPSKCLGRNGSWMSTTDGAYKLLMVGGDRELCPGNIDRRSIIMFTCGLEDKVTRVYENDRCIYVVDFITPAAC